MTVNGADLFHMSVKVTLGHVLVAEKLEEHVGMHVLTLLCHHHFLHDIRGTDDKAHSHARRQDLGE